MLSEQLLSYIKENTQAGFSRPEIEAALRAAGWSDVDIAAGFASDTPASAAPAPSTLQQDTNREVVRAQDELRRSHEAAPARRTSNLSDFLIQHKLASSKETAQLILVVTAMLFCFVVYFVFF